MEPPQAASIVDPYRLGLVSPSVHYFALVARLGSIRRAAEALNVAPSSISRVIKNMEQELGTLLFERVRQRLKLTSAGELMLYHARLSVTELRRACSSIDDLHGLHRGSVSVATIESASRSLIPSVLEAFWLRHPDITADFRVAGSQEVCDAVTAGDCELGVAFDVRPARNLRRVATALFPLGVLARPGSSFARKKELKLSDLSGERLILSDSSLMLGLSVEEAFSRSLIDVFPRSRTNSIGLMVEMAKMDLGTVLQTRVGIEKEIARGELLFVPLRDPKIGQRRLMLLSRPEKELSGAGAAFLTLLAQAIEKLKI
ncbi:MAG: LysR family transcriptional regulator [Rhodomicrobium sp.]